MPLDKVGDILNSLATVIVAIGVVVVLFKVSGLITALSKPLGDEEEEGKP